MPTSINVRLFIDESGSPDKYIPDKTEDHDKFFTIACVLIEQSNYLKFKQELDVIRGRYSIYLLNKEIKSNYIRVSNPKYLASKGATNSPYLFWKNKIDGQKIYDSFCAEIRFLLQLTEFKIVSVTIDKQTVQDKFPNHNHHYAMLLDLWERISIYYLLNNKPKMKIVFDRTKGYADTILKKTYADFKRQGTWFFNGERLTGLNLDKDVYSCDSESSVGIQLVDLCAYPIKKFHEGKENDFFKHVIKSKLYNDVKDRKTGKRIKMGTKRCFK